MKYSISNILRSSTFIIACLFHAGAHAEAKVGDRFGDWIFECQATAADKTICALSQTIVNTKNNRRLVKLSLKNDKAQGKAELVAMVPLGIFLPSGVSGTIDQGKPFQFVVRTCLQQGCVATAVADGSMLKNLQGGTKLAISFSGRATDKPLVITGSLKGLADGMKAINLK